MTFESTMFRGYTQVCTLTQGICSVLSFITCAIAMSFGCLCWKHANEDTSSEIFPALNLCRRVVGGLSDCLKKCVS